MGRLSSRSKHFHSAPLDGQCTKRASMVNQSTLRASREPLQLFHRGRRGGRKQHSGKNTTVGACMLSRVAASAASASSNQLVSLAMVCPCECVRRQEQNGRQENPAPFWVGGPPTGGERRRGQRDPLNSRVMVPQASWGEVKRERNLALKEPGGMSCFHGGRGACACVS
jgi:hypothetical protein